MIYRLFPLLLILMTPAALAQVPSQEDTGQVAHVLDLTHQLAQVPSQEDTLSQAHALSTEGRYGEGAALLARYVSAHPDDASASLLLAQLQYWSGDARTARSTYAAAVERHPAGAELRLSYARFLMDHGETAAARRVLHEIRGNAGAKTLLGTIAWWRGDLTTAARHFKAALHDDPNQDDARTALHSIRSDARPWLLMDGGLGSDTQPLTYASGVAAIGIYLTPLQTLRVKSRWSRYPIDDAPLNVMQITAGHGAYWAAARLETDFVAGLYQRSDATEPIGSMSATLRLPYSLKLSGRVERSPYHYTEASIREPVMTSAAAATLTVDRRGWLGEAAVRRERYPDSNVKNVAYGWLMAPLVRSQRLTLQAGYAYGYQDAEENRFAAVLAAPPAPGRKPEWEGRYLPYYTPVNWQTHSATGSLSLMLWKGAMVTANGAYAVAASEEAPFIYQQGPGAAPVVGFYHHRINPWNLRVGLSAEVTPSVVLKLEGSHVSHTWYDASNAGLSLFVRM